MSNEFILHACASDQCQYCILVIKKIDKNQIQKWLDKPYRQGLDFGVSDKMHQLLLMWDCGSYDWDLLS